MLEAYGLTDLGCVRQNNEDYYLIKPEIGLYLVADGMGGELAGETASNLAAETVAEFVSQSRDRDPDLLGLAFDEANRRVRSLAASDRSMEGMGTTLVAVLDRGDHLEIANVGDSRCYRFAAGELTPVTTDQSWVQEVGLKLGLTEEKLRDHPYRHILTMAIGGASKLRVDQHTLPVVPGEQYLLSSDGLHGPLTDEFLAEVLGSERTLAEKCHLLIEAARAAGGPDNITAVLLRTS